MRSGFHTSLGAAASILVAVLAPFSGCSDEPEEAERPPAAEPHLDLDAGSMVIGEPLVPPVHDTPPPIPSLGTGWFESPEALVAAVIDAAAKGDDLAALRVTEEEHERLLWPSFPSSDPSMNIPHGLAWSNLNNRCRKGQRALTAQLREGNSTLVELRFESPAQPYEGFELHPGTHAKVKDERGREEEIELLGSVVEYGGLFKLLSYREP